MKKLSIIFVLAVLVIFSWGILQAAAPARVAYCEYDCDDCSMCTQNIQCYCFDTLEGPYSCWDYCCAGACL